MSVDGGVNREDVVHVCNGILLTYKIEWNNAICNNMHEPIYGHTKWSKSDRESQIPYDVGYMWNLE